ncbi:MAG: TSUP family transporter [Zoogloeaceae bacterium]|nr:TSUP family transporter [Zoogloeaceae bacterium]
MGEIESVLILIGVAAFMAGFVDAVVGGGGLIQIPALFSAFPSASPATLFGTNKIASIVGTSSAAVQYSRRVPIPWKIALPGALAALVGAWFGARAVAWMPVEYLRPLVLILLVLVAVYTFVRKDFGTASSRQALGRRDVGVAVTIALTVGFYDGFFGPGTGSFFIFLLVRFVALDFLHASATAKVLNVATNLAALSFFAANVELLWKAGVLMAVCNLGGALIGSRLAIRHGAAFVRQIFLFVVTVLIAKMAYDLMRG